MNLDVLHQDVRHLIWRMTLKLLQMCVCVCVCVCVCMCVFCCFWLRVLCVRECSLVLTRKSSYTPSKPLRHTLTLPVVKEVVQTVMFAEAQVRATQCEFPREIKRDIIDPVTGIYIPYNCHEIATFHFISRKVSYVDLVGLTDVTVWPSHYGLMRPAHFLRDVKPDVQRALTSAKYSCNIVFFHSLIS